MRGYTMNDHEEIEILDLCSGDCDYCYWKRTVPGTDERIDREPSYYCALFEKEG